MMRGRSSLQATSPSRIEPDIVARADAERGAVIDAEPAQNTKEGVVRAEAGAASRKVLGAALEHVDAPAGRAQQVRGEQSAERAADDQRVAIRSHCDITR